MAKYYARKQLRLLDRTVVPGDEITENEMSRMPKAQYDIHMKYGWIERQDDEQKNNPAPAVQPSLAQKPAAARPHHESHRHTGAKETLKTVTEKAKEVAHEAKESIVQAVQSVAESAKEVTSRAQHDDDEHGSTVQPPQEQHREHRAKKRKAR